jgi:antitoxin VapB
MEDLETAQLFMNGRSQAVRLPKPFRFEGKQVHIKRIGQSVVLTPIGSDRWSALEDALMAFEFEAGFDLERPKSTPQKERENLFL